MRSSDTLWDSFFDGFTMAGFLNRIERQGATTHLFATVKENGTSKEKDELGSEDGAE